MMMMMSRRKDDHYRHLFAPIMTLKNKHVQ